MGHFQCQAGASSVRLRLVPGRHARPEARSSGDGEIATPSCSTLAIRAGNRLGFLAAIGALIGSPEGISMEVRCGVMSLESWKVFRTCLGFA